MEAAPDALLVAVVEVAVTRRFVSVHGDLLRLADAVDARHPLQVVLRVPVGVVEHDSVGGGERDADAARPRRQQEREGVGVATALESVDGGVAEVAAH